MSHFAMNVTVIMAQSMPNHQRKFCQVTFLAIRQISCRISIKLIGIRKCPLCSFRKHVMSWLKHHLCCYNENQTQQITNVGWQACKCSVDCWTQKWLNPHKVNTYICTQSVVLWKDGTRVGGPCVLGNIQTLEAIPDVHLWALLSISIMPVHS